ncbi:MAG: nucleotide excision repair endonuclease, partial [Candidatus Pacebacteria bacterium]|nr:nucleotide excision repair endonuclease [Candidatus Paceibacterota bacterium]
MTEELREKIKGLPGSAGAYIFKDSQESIIYVGKAKNIKKRIKNHFQKPDQHAYDFTGQIAEIDFIETAGEKEALLLEQK